MDNWANDPQIAFTPLFCRFFMHFLKLLSFWSLTSLPFVATFCYIHYNIKEKVSFWRAWFSYDSNYVQCDKLRALDKCWDILGAPMAQSSLEQAWKVPLGHSSAKLSSVKLAISLQPQTLGRCNNASVTLTGTLPLNVLSYTC